MLGGGSWCCFDILCKIGAAQATRSGTQVARSSEAPMHEASHPSRARSGAHDRTSADPRTIFQALVNSVPTSRRVTPSARRSTVRCATRHCAKACRYFHGGSHAEPGTEIAPVRKRTLHDACLSFRSPAREALHSAISRSIVMRATPCTHSRTGAHWSR